MIEALQNESCHHYPAVSPAAVRLYASLTVMFCPFSSNCLGCVGGLAALPVPAKSPPFASLSPGSAMHAVSWQRVQVSFVKTVVGVGSGKR